MKTPNCLLITTLLAVTLLLGCHSVAYGADEAQWTKNRLKGFGENGIRVNIEDRDNQPDSRPLTKIELRTIKAQIELKLKQAGFKVAKLGEGSYNIYYALRHMEKKVNGVEIRSGLMQVSRIVEFTTKDGKKRKCWGTVLTSGNFYSTKPANEIVDNQIDVFISTWRKDNPKK